MLKSHELFGFMSPALATRIIEFTHDDNKPLYRTVLGTVAQARNMRPAFFERSPRATRHATMAAMLAKPRLEPLAANILRDWLMKQQVPMLSDFMDTLAIPHKDGAVDELPPTVDDAQLQAALDKLLSKYPPEEVSVYLNAFFTMNDVRWPNLENALKTDTRLQFGS
jgi:hypothetical protein